ALAHHPDLEVTPQRAFDLGFEFGLADLVRRPAGIDPPERGPVQQPAPTAARRDPSGRHQIRGPDPVGVRRRARLRTGWVTARPSRAGRWLAGRRTAGWGTGLVRPSGLRRPRSVFRGRRRAGVAAGCLALRLAGAGSSGTVGGLTIAEEPGYRVDR